jgi:hypothetical protein
MPPDLLADLIASPFFVGAAGALVSLKYVPALGWWKHASNWVCGTLVAGYCAPPLAGWLKLDGDGGVAFMLGLLGLSILNAIVRAISELKLADIIAGWIGRRG